jgi:hypothetical protein
MNGGRISRLKLEDGREFGGKMFIDTTYEGDLLPGAGVAFTIGREANSAYGETVNGIQSAKATNNQLPNGIDPYVIPGDATSGLLPGVNPNAGGADGTADHRLQASVGLGAYTMDSHHVQRQVKNGQVKNEGDIQKYINTTGPYPISYRSIVPKRGECSNLLVPWSLSATHMAFGSIRMEPVFMILSQSAAFAACLSIDRNIAVQDLAYSDLHPVLDTAGIVLGDAAAEANSDNDDDGLSALEESILGLNPEISDAMLIAGIKADPNAFGLHASDEIHDATLQPPAIGSNGDGGVQIECLLQGENGPLDSFAVPAPSYGDRGFYRFALPANP